MLPTKQVIRQKEKENEKQHIYIHQKSAAVNHVVAKGNADLESRSR